tara:strand:- start:2428 stop:3456 length:1029 start_codon:yes stop_codon:yes gene_type:complete
MIEEKSFKKLSIFVALGILAALTILILWPIATAIVTGLILSYIFYPLYNKVFSITKKKNISALIIILFAILVILIPTWFLLPLFIKQIFDLYLYLQTFDINLFFQTLFPSIAETDFSQSLANSVNTFVSNFVTLTLSSSSKIFLNFTEFALKSVVVFFVLFFGMRDAELFSDYVKSLSPFSKTTEKDLSTKFKDITSSVIRGFILVGILQGILVGIGLFILGVPQALLLTITAIFTSIIPVLGAWVVWIPAVIYLFVKGSIIKAILLAIYGGIFVSWIDNILRPYIVSRKTKISSVIIVVGMIGGLLVFGILGLIIGPLILSYLFLILDAYRNRSFPSLFFQ